MALDEHEQPIDVPHNSEHMQTAATEVECAISSIVPSANTETDARDVGGPGGVPVLVGV